MTQLLSSCRADLVINVGVSEPIADNNEVGLDDEDAILPKKDDVKTSPSSSTAIFKQTVRGNSSTDTVTIDYVEPDGTRVTQLTDFRMRAQVTRVILLGEEELNEPAYQVLCFVSAFTGDLIPPEAVMKLRQKHPGTVRVAESDEGSVVQDSPLILVADRQSSISSHLPALCGGGGRKPATAAIFTSTHEVHSILQHSVHNVDDVAKPYPAYSDLERCSSVSPLSGGGVACQCSRPVEFYWYPCALKYCRNQDSEGEHRCGIRTCKKTMMFRYPAMSKQHCLWDEV